MKKRQEYEKNGKLSRRVEEYTGKLSGKVAIVTGGFSNIGKGIAEQYVKYGATVLMIDDERENHICRDVHLRYYKEYYPADVTKEEQICGVIKEIAEKYGHIDILAYASMYGKMYGFEEEGSIESRDRTFAVNINGAWNAAKAVIPYMKQNGGAIVIVGSSTGFLVADSREAAYATSKAALVGLTKALAVEYAVFNIRVNTICQGYIQTELCEKAAYDTNPENPQKVLDEIAAGIPMKRLGTCKEVGEAAAFLASDESSYITGIQLIIDGGNSLPETNRVGR